MRLDSDLDDRLDDELDARLDRALRVADPAAAAPSVSAAELTRMLSRARRIARPRLLTRRVRTVAASIAGLALVGGTVVAGTSYHDYWMHREPFVSLDAGQTRSDEHIRFIPAVGQDRGEHCDLYPEFSGITATQLAAVDQRIRTADWTGMGDDVLAEAVAAGSITDSMDADARDTAYTDALTDHLVAAFAPDVPGLHRVDLDAVQQQGVTLDGWTFTCRGTW